MAVNSITFDPDAGVPYGVNLTINTGSEFESNFHIVRTSSAEFDLNGYSASAPRDNSRSRG